MKEVKAYIRSHKVETVLESLDEAGFDDATLIDVLGVGSYSDPKTAKYSFKLVEKYSDLAKLELVCKDADVHTVVEVIRSAAYSGRRGDGMVFVSPVEMAIKIRTGAAGEAGL